MNLNCFPAQSGNRSVLDYPPYNLVYRFLNVNLYEIDFENTFDQTIQHLQYFQIIVQSSIFHFFPRRWKESFTDNSRTI